MKHYIYILIASLFSFIQVQAQSTDDTHVEVKAGQELLENLLTDGQKQHITHLTVKGTLQEADYAYLRNTLFKQLEELNLRDADIDTIPAHAFDCEPERHFPNFIEKKMNIHLPRSLKHLSDSSLLIRDVNCIYILYGKFPTLGTNSYAFKDYNHKLRYEFSPSANNPYLKMNGDILCSIDGLCVFTSNHTYAYIPDGTKFIYKEAYINSEWYQNQIPASVDSIGDRAFAYLIGSFPTCFGCPDPLFYCAATIPPKMGSDVFHGSDLLTIYVPDESVQLYQNAPGWKDLDLRIVGITQGIENVKSERISIQDDGNNFILKCNLPVRQIKFFDMNGNNFNVIKNSSDVFIINKNTLSHVFACLQILYNDGKTETIKIKL